MKNLPESNLDLEWNMYVHANIPGKSLVLTRAIYNPDNILWLVLIKEE